MREFDWQPRTRLVYGAGALARLGELAAGLGLRRVLIVTDAGIVQAGHVAHAEESLQAANVATAVFSGVHENPDTEDVAACLAVAQDFGCDGFVGLGGGSAMDTAKGANFLLTNGGEVRDYWRTHNATKPLLPLIAVPTTAGTGSEVQCHALIADAATHAKMAIGDPKATPVIALLDPELTLSLPLAVTANVGIDALVHALEAWVTKPRNPVSNLFAKEAFTLLLPNFKRVLLEPGDLEARGAMLLGAAYAGHAIESSMLGAAHSAANPLTAHFGVVHGQAVGRMLPHVIRFNAQEPSVRALYEALLPLETLLEELESGLNLAGFPTSLAEYGVTDNAIPTLAAEAVAQWTASFNPRLIAAADFEVLYRAALTPPLEGGVNRRKRHNGRGGHPS